MIIGVITGLLSTGCLTLCGFMYKQLKKFINDFETLKSVERNNLKANIVNLYERSRVRGYITHMELESVNKLGKSYSDLGGNSYIESLIHIMSTDLEIKGDSIASVYAMVAEQNEDLALKKKAKDHLEKLENI